MPDTPIIFCSIIWKNYVAHARTLAQSLRERHPDVPFVLLLADRADGYIDPAAEPFEIVEIEALPIPDMRRFCFQYSPFLLNTAVKPWFLAHLLARPGVRTVLYFDADILVLHPLDELCALLDRASIVLTPHLIAPARDAETIAKVERSLLLFGAYNLGFIGVARTATTEAFLAWWQARLLRDCLLYPARGLFVDQKWIDLALGMFDGVHVLRDPTYNVARWNLHERALSVAGDRVLVDGMPCRFFHFSGFDPRSTEVAKGNRYYTVERLGQAVELYRRYSERLRRNGFDETIAWPQAFSTFANGVPIPDDLRLDYLAMGDDVVRFGDPFATDSPNSFYAAWQAEQSGLGGLARRLRRRVAYLAGRVQARLG